jgi:hypothetical protein
MDTNKDFHGTRHNWVKRELDLRRNQPHIYKEQRSIMVGPVVRTLARLNILGTS